MLIAKRKGPMFDRFTAQARQATTLARQEALRPQNGHIGTEHILLGLLAMEEGAATHALQSLGVDRARMRAAVDGLTEKGEVEKPPGHRHPRTWTAEVEILFDLLESFGAPRLKAALERAVERKLFGAHYVRALLQRGVA